MLKIDARSSKIGAPGPSKLASEALKIEAGDVPRSQVSPYTGSASDPKTIPAYRPPPCFTLFSFFFLLRFFLDFEPLFLSFSSLFPLFFLFFRLAFFGLNFGSIFGRFFVNF